MKDTDYNNLIECIYRGAFIPVNQNAHDLSNRCRMGESVFFKEAKERDLKFHRCYFSLLNFIYSYLPIKFQEAVSQDNFYTFLKHLKGLYRVLFKFKDGTTLVEYESISFGRMSQKAFEEYVSEQMPFIYENIIMECYNKDHEEGRRIIALIEKEYDKFLNML